MELQATNNFNIVFGIFIGLGRISGIAGYPAGYPAIFNIRPDTGYWNYPAGYPVIIFFI